MSSLEIYEAFRQATTGREPGNARVEIPKKCNDLATQILEGVVLYGGVSLSVNPRVRVPNHGYMVGGLVPERIVKWHDTGTRFADHDYLREEAGLFVMENWLRITAHPGFRVVGAWLNSETGHVHLDVSEWRVGLQEALNLAKERHELAIWDLKGSQEIRVEG